MGGGVSLTFVKSKVYHGMKYLDLVEEKSRGIIHIY